MPSKTPTQAPLTAPAAPQSVGVRKMKPKMKRKVPQRDGLKAYAQSVAKRFGG
jgi:hypothetical protein